MGWQHLVASSGARVSNTWVTCPRDRDTLSKGRLRLDTLFGLRGLGRKAWRKRRLEEGLAAYQLVGEVTAHQGDDG